MHQQHSNAADWGLALIRVNLGVILLAHGLLKLFVFTLPGTAAFFASLGLPAFTAYLTVFGEILGGAALIAGFQSRLVAVLNLPILVGAAVVHIGNGWMFSAPGGGWEFPVTLIVMAIALAFGGGGKARVPALPFINARLPQFLRD